jgi:hypothetical protein
MRINVTGMQGNRLVIRQALPEMAATLPYNWSLENVASAIALLKTGRSNKIKKAALDLLELLRNRETEKTHAKHTIDKRRNIAGSS